MPMIIAALEVRLATNLEYWRENGYVYIKSASSHAIGIGRSYKEAGDNLLTKMGLTP